jgi:Family of unknown function (DUF6298)
MESSLMDRRAFLARVGWLAGPAALAVSATSSPGAADAPADNRDTSDLETTNGWYVQGGKVIWGYARANAWWGGYRGQPSGWWTDIELGPSLIRNDPGRVGPNRTEDLDQLTTSMSLYGYPGFEHTPPLWYDRRRDAHDVVARADGNVVPPFLEMPWARSHQGRAWDGLSLYDLTQFNPWYFARLRETADDCDRKGCVLFFNFYNQHNLLETQAHYADYPWRPANCIQATDLPDQVPAANVFYDTTHPVRRELHRHYIWHCLDNLKANRRVVFLTGFEFTGPLAFMQFWFETIFEWERRVGRKVHLGLDGTRDVVEAILNDPRYGPRVGTIDLRGWHFKSDGTLFAPAGGREVPGRYIGGSSQMTPQQVYRQVKEFRQRYPDKAIIHYIDADLKQTMAFLMAGGSMLVRTLDEVREYPAGYEMPLGCENILIAYDLIRTRLAADLARMRPLDVVSRADGVWCLGDPGNAYLIYMLRGQPFRLDLSEAPGVFEAKWIGLRLGKVFEAFGGRIEGGKVHDLQGLDWRQWMLWLKRRP